MCFGVRDGRQRRCAAPAGSQTGCVCCVAGAAAGRDGGGDGGVQRRAPLVTVAAREALARGKQDNMITSSGPKAQGKSIMHPGLTASLPRHC